MKTLEKQEFFKITLKIFAKDLHHPRYFKILKNTFKGFFQISEESLKI